jgi:predicted Rossmann-fold nucleotide-binding protein
MSAWIFRAVLIATSCFAAASITGCSMSGRARENSTLAATPDLGTVVTCATSETLPNVRYIGLYRGVENNLTSKDMAQDLYCAEQFKTKNFPRGFVTIFGSSRIKEVNTAGNADAIAANNELYRQIRSFANQWTRKHGSEYPILTGAGPGLMEAGSRGASDAGKSIGYTTYYGPAAVGDGKPELALAKHGADDITTDGLIFSSVAMREALMILHSAAIVIAPGGTGTEWEIFQILETIKSKQLTCVPVYIVGNRKIHWQSFDDRLADMVNRTTVKEAEVTQYVEYVDNAEDLIGKLPSRLGQPCA